MTDLYFLLQKEFLILRNTHFRSTKQTSILFALIMLVLLVTAAIVWASSAWLKPLTENVPQAIIDETIRSLLMIIFTWLSLLFFFSAVQESKNRFFLSPDLSLLLATPINPIILIVFRFFLFVGFNSSNFVSLCIFGLGPLISIGVLISAPYYYYILLLPVTYLYLFIPAALGMIMIMLLLRYFTPRRIFQMAAIINAILVVLWISFVLVNQEQLLSRIIILISNMESIFDFMFPLLAVTDLLSAVLGIKQSYAIPLFTYLACVVGTSLVAILIIQSVYFHNYERLQFSENLIGKQKRKSFLNLDFSFSTHHSPIALLLSNQWKMAIRNRQVAQGAFGIVTLIVGYLVIMGTIIEHGGPNIMLANIFFMSFFIITGVQVFFLPYASLSDRQILLQQYWIYKASPLDKRHLIWSMILAQLIPALPLGFVVLVLANIFTGIPVDLTLLSIVLMTFYLASYTSLIQVTSLLQTGSLGEETPLMTKALREFAPILISAIVILPLFVGFNYLQIDLLSFLHSLPQISVIISCISLSLLMMAMSFLFSILHMKGIWKSIEIK